MKALAAEVTANFGKRLEPLGRWPGPALALRGVAHGGMGSPLPWLCSLPPAQPAHMHGAAARESRDAVGRQPWASSRRGVALRGFRVSATHALHLGQVGR